MFSIGLYELLIIIILALLIVSPQDLPEISKNMGKILKKLRKMFDKMQTSIDKISTDIVKEDNFKTWEDRVEEKRAEYNINIKSIENFINDENQKKHTKKK